MVRAVPDILARIAAQKRAALPTLQARRTDLEWAAASRTSYRDFRRALTTARPAIIAEIKKASPSKGELTADFDAPAIAASYAEGGAAALSVLTDEEFFQGSNADLEAARAAVTIPVLRKDFTLDEIHVIEAAAHGADAILLIAALLDERQLRTFREKAERLRMAALVEIHDDTELKIAVASGARIIGVNNRNLHTFEVAIETAVRLAPWIPASVIKIAESGIDSRESMVRLQQAGYQGFLIGEHLMRSLDPAEALKELLA